ncbi:MAG: T9SS type A sorting domain-containing protein [Chitinophagaceae bacterium]|nr:T9SS type A sorting domain-containing protein [Chitinophagaceae bacterium]
MYSLNGQTIKQWQNVNAYQPLNISSLRRGIYIVKITHATGEAVQLILKK